MSRKGELIFKRKADAAIRAHVFRRDAFCCVHCGWRPDNIPANYDGRYTVLGSVNDSRMLQIDHVIPLSRGGTNAISNLQTLCCSCNASKCDRAAPRAA